MSLREFKKVGHWPSLVCAFLYFDISFMVWVLIGALSNVIAADFALSDEQKGFLVGVPILGGSILRLVLGWSTDRIGARKTGLLGLSLTFVPLLLGWLWAGSYSALIGVGLLLGVAGASFAAALPLASRWYPPQYQGLAMGIAGAGNSGTALATFFGPLLAVAGLGWHGVFGLALIPVFMTLVVFALFAKDSPAQPAPKPLGDYFAVLKHADTWWFNLFYSVTFGGFVGLASYLNIFFREQYGLGKVNAGSFVTLCVIAGSFLRPVGGYLADKLGGIRLLLLLYSGIGLVLFGVAALPPLYLGTALLFIGMGLLGMGNGAVFQLVPQRFSKEIGVVTGIVGAAGGVGGFFLPTVFGILKGQFNSFGYGFAVFGLVAFACVGLLVYVVTGWQGKFISRTGLANPIESEELVPEPVSA